MELSFVQVVLALLLVIHAGECQIDLYDVTYANIRENDCAPEATRNGQRFLFTNYRALYDYRKYHHDYSRLEASKDDPKAKLKKQTKGGNEDKPDSPDNDGSVLFFNWDDNHGVVRMACPCGTRKEKNPNSDAYKREDALSKPKFVPDEIGWEMLGKGSAKFQEGYGKDKSNPLQFTPPIVRYYYRTFACYLQKNKDKRHYINVFTRPTGYTTFPIQYLQGPSGLKLYPKQPVQCSLHQYYRSLDEELHQKDTYYGVPFQFFWKFPGDTEEAKKLEKSHDELEYQRPPHGDIYWGKQTVDDSGSNPSVLVEHHPTNIKVLFENEKSRPKSVDSEEGFSSFDDYEQTDFICKERLDSKLPTVLRTQLKFDPNKPVSTEIRGKYACVVVDVNGLSSAYWWDGDLAPKSPYRGFVQIHVRDFLVVYIAIACIGAGLLLVVVLIFLLPDNMEDFKEDPATDSGGVTSEGSEAAAASSKLSMKPTKRTAKVADMPQVEEPPPQVLEKQRASIRSIKSIHSEHDAQDDRHDRKKKKKEKAHSFPV